MNNEAVSTPSLKIAEKVAEKSVASPVRARSAASVRELLEKNSRLLDAVDPELSEWAGERLRGDTSTEPDALKTPQKRVQMLALLRELRSTVEAAATAREARSRLELKYQAVSQVKNEVLRQFLTHIRPVERFYRELHGLFTTAEGNAAAFVLPVLPEELDDKKFSIEECPPKLKNIQDLLARRNNIIDPAGWIGVLPIPFEGKQFSRLHEEYIKLADAHYCLLLVSPHARAPGLQAVLDELTTDKSPLKKLGSGLNPRAAHFYGDLRVRPAWDLLEPGGKLEADHLEAPPTLFVAGAICRNDKTIGTQQPPSSIKYGAGGHLSGFEQPVRTFSTVEVDAAHNAKPQPLNLTFYKSRDQVTYMYGSMVAGDPRFKTYEVRRILDKLEIMVQNLLRDEQFITTSSELKKKVMLEERSREILRKQYEKRAIQSKFEVRAKRGETSQSWTVEVDVCPSAVDTLFTYVISPKQDEGNG